MFKLKQLNVSIHNNTERGGGDYHLALKIKLTITFRHFFSHIITKRILKSSVYFYFLLRHPVEFYLLNSQYSLTFVFTS